MEISKKAIDEFDEFFKSKIKELDTDTYIHYEHQKGGGTSFKYEGGEIALMAAIHEILLEFVRKQYKDNTEVQISLVKCIAGEVIKEIKGEGLYGDDVIFCN